MILSGEYFYSIAALFSCTAYLLGNILWLRVFLIFASTIYIFSGVTLGITSMVGWNSAYLAINLYHIFILLFDKSTIMLPEETREIYRLFFSTMSTREFKKIILINLFRIVKDEKIVRESEITNKLFIVLKGKVDIVKSERTIASLFSGDLIGEMSFMSKQPASASAVASGTVQYAYWTHNDLEELKLKNSNTYNKFISIIGCDLVRKLNKKNEVLDELTTKLDYFI